MLTEKYLKMSAIEAIRPIIRVFQLFALSTVPVPVPVKSKHKRISLDEYFKIYSLLNIVFRVIIFLYASIANHFFIRQTEYKIIAAIDTVLISGIRLVEISILVEAFLGRANEKRFIKNLIEIDEILRIRFNIDMKYGDLRRSAFKLSIIWICIFVFAQGIILYLAYGSSAYFYFCLTYLPPFLTSSISYFQIITWTNLIRYRFCVLNRLINDMARDSHCDQVNWIPMKGFRNMFVNEVAGKTYKNYNPMYEAHLFDHFVTIRSIYHRLWNQTDVINRRFRCSMVVNIGNDFVSLLSNFYWMFMCMLRPNVTLNISVVGSFLWSLINIFHISMLCKICHNTAKQASQIAHVTHCIQHVTLNSKLSSFVCNF